MAAAVAIASQIPTPNRRGMKHLYSNCEGEVVAADTLDQAAHYHDCELGGAERPEDGWYQIGDSAELTIVDWDEPGQPSEKMTAAQWAGTCSEPTQVSSTYC